SDLVVVDEVHEQRAAVGPFLLQTPALTLGFLTRYLLGDQARTFFCLGLLPTRALFFRQLLLTQALFLGLARGLGLQLAALGGEPLLLGSPLLAGGLFPGKLLLPGRLFPG